MLSNGGGLTLYTYYKGHCIVYLLTVSLLTFASVLVVRPKVFSKSSFTGLYLLFWVPGASLFGYILFLSECLLKYTSARQKSIMAVLLYFTTSFFSSISNDLPLLQFIPTVSMANQASLLASLESPLH